MPVGSSLPILCLRRARPPSCESRVEPGFGVAAELGGGLALEPAANVGQRLARQRVAHCLFGLEHDRMDRAHAARRPLGRAVLEQSATPRSEEHTSELQSQMRCSYAVFCLNKKPTQ